MSTDEVLTQLCDEVRQHLHSKIDDREVEPQTPEQQAASLAGMARGGMWNELYELTGMLLEANVTPAVAHVRAEAQITQGDDWNAAVQTCDLLLAKHPGDARGHFYRALAHAYLGDQAEASADLGRARAVESPDPSVTPQVDQLAEALG